MNVGAGFFALLGFVLYNVIQRTGYEMGDMQSAVLMLLTFLGLVKFTEPFLKDLGGPRVIRKTVVVEKPVIVETVPEWGTPNEGSNSKAGQPETTV